MMPEQAAGGGEGSGDLNYSERFELLQLHDQSATPQNSCGMFVSLQGANFVDQLHMSCSCRD
jgi:hypothetical protein